MEIKNIQYCSMIDHIKSEAISFCPECKIYMCNKCDLYHNGLFKTHHKYKLDKNKNIEEIFTGICKVENHINKLIYFCKTHNELCCAECITKIKGKKNGQHTDCTICFVEDIENDKKNQLKENIKNLEDLSTNLNSTINEIKKIYEQNINNKDKLKEEIQKYFTNIRNSLNKREDELLLEVDKIYKEKFCDEKIINKLEKLPENIKNSLEKGKIIIDEWKNNELSSLLNDCLNIENNIKEINYINESIKKFKSLNLNIKFIPLTTDDKEILETIEKFGKIKDNLFQSKIELDDILVASWLNNKNFTAELLYRKSRDGSTPQDFHSKCDNKGTTITFIETTKGYKFGGYTETPWDCSNLFKKDNSTFLFSLNNREKYISKNDKKPSLACDTNSGPRFGNDDIRIYQTLNKGETREGNEKFLSNRKITNGEQYWDIKELEVYKINYI